MNLSQDTRARPLWRGVASGVMSVGLAVLAACAAPASAPGADAISGVASYRERIALPPQAVFEATLIDVSRPGAPARVLGRTQVQPVTGPSIAFRIPYDAAAIDARASYAVRATLSVEGRLWFTTDTVHPVLTRGAGTQVTLPLRMVRAEPPVTPPSH